jgi:hypothetical protein
MRARIRTLARNLIAAHGQIAKIGSDSNLHRRPPGRRNAPTFFCRLPPALAPARSRPAQATSSGAAVELKGCGCGAVSRAHVVRACFGAMLAIGAQRHKKPRCARHRGLPVMSEAQTLIPDAVRHRRQGLPVSKYAGARPSHLRTLGLCRSVEVMNGRSLEESRPSFATKCRKSPRSGGKKPPKAIGSFYYQ